MTEEWKPVVGFEGRYEVSNLGRVRSFERTVIDKRGRRRVFPGVIIMPYLRDNGRLIIGLWKNGSKKNYFLHRIVAMAFLPNPDNLPCINHKDENPQNNRVENLEWCTVAYNLNYGTRIERLRINNRTVAVIGTDKNGNEHYFSSRNEAARITGVCRTSISQLCKGTGVSKQTAGGYRWRYAEKRNTDYLTPTPFLPK